MATDAPIQRIDTPRRPDWAIILLTRVRRGTRIEDARKQRGSLVSTDTLQRYGRMDPEWFADLMDAQEGIRTERVLIDDLAHAKATALDEEARRHDLAMGAVDERPVRDRDALQAMRLGAEVRGRVGSAAGAPTVAVQVNVYPGGMAHVLQAHVREREARRLTPGIDVTPARPRVKPTEGDGDAPTA